MNADEARTLPVRHYTLYCSPFRLHRVVVRCDNCGLYTILVCDLSSPRTKKRVYLALVTMYGLLVCPTRR